ncbi:hypothetical protein EDB81DRAFT_160452 [Dactylonectria macrodidyma]|uniref:Uncharacterized protein n=1 Tax=Dactylonectria macrodidyma TaxID=307937 RepID=A0A9P9FNR0_9HYPO|nr:hypothetical protein EDB81DRAFT_160452 [Dactylonectria macrodidyma]
MLSRLTAISSSPSSLRTAGFSTMQFTNWTEQAVNWTRRNPVQAAALGGTLVVAAAPALVVTPALGAAGFGAHGVVGGSLATAWQSSIGSVIAPSAFSILQSAGAGGAGMATVCSAVQGSAVGAAGAALGAWLRTKKGNKEEGDGSAKGDESTTANRPEGGGGPDGDSDGAVSKKASAATGDGGHGDET